MKRTVIAENSVLSTLAKAPHHADCHSRPEMLLEIYGSPVIVAKAGVDEMKRTSASKPGPAQFAEALPKGFESADPKSVDRLMAQDFRVKKEKDLGDVHSLGLAEEAAERGEEVVLIADDETLNKKTEARFKADGYNVTIQDLGDVLCLAALRGKIPSAAAELKAMEEAGITTPNLGIAQRVERFQVRLDTLREQADKVTRTYHNMLGEALLEQPRHGTLPEAVTLGSAEQAVRPAKEGNRGAPKQTAVLDQIFLEVEVLRGGVNQLLQEFHVVIPESVAHAARRPGGPEPVRTWLQKATQDPSFGVTVEAPTHPLPDDPRLLRGTLEAMQLVRENEGRVLLTGSRLAFSEALKEQMPVNDPVGVASALKDLGNEANAAAPMLVKERFGDIARARELQEIEALREVTETRCGVRELESDLAKGPQTIHGLDRKTLLQDLRNASDPSAAKRDITGKLELAAGVARKTEAIQPLISEQEQTSEQETQADHGDDQEHSM